MYGLFIVVSFQDSLQINYASPLVLTFALKKLKAIENTFKK